jgi:hypothetical protein
VSSRRGGDQAASCATLGRTAPRSPQWGRSGRLVCHARSNRTTLTTVGASGCARQTSDACPAPERPLGSAGRVRATCISDPIRGLPASYCLWHHLAEDASLRAAVAHVRLAGRVLSPRRSAGRATRSASAGLAIPHAGVHQTSGAGGAVSLAAAPPPWVQTPGVSGASQACFAAKTEPKHKRSKNVMLGGAAERETLGFEGIEK